MGRVVLDFQEFVCIAKGFSMYFGTVALGNTTQY